MRSLDEFATTKLAELERADLRRRLVDTTRLDGIWAVRNGRRLLSFSCNDYLNLSQHPAVKAAAIEALQQFGTGSGASRLVTGNHPLFADLETRLALDQVEGRDRGRHHRGRQAGRIDEGAGPIADQVDHRR